MVGQVKVRFCIVFVLLAGIIAVIGCSPSPSEEEIRQIVQSEVAKLELPVPLALESQAPMVIDVPVRTLQLPRAKQHSHLASIPWTQPQEGLISS